LKKLIFGCLAATLVTIGNSCTRKSIKQELVLHFKSYTFETLDGENKFQGIDFPIIACNSTFIFYSDSTIKVHLEVVRTKNTNNSSYKWVTKKENNTEGKIWTSFKLKENASGVYALSIRKNSSQQITAVSVTDSRKKTIFLDN